MTILAFPNDRASVHREPVACLSCGGTDHRRENRRAGIRHECTNCGQAYWTLVPTPDYTNNLLEWRSA